MTASAARTTATKRERTALWVALGTTALANGLLLVLVTLLNQPRIMPPEEPVAVRRLVQPPPPPRPPTVAAVKAPTPSMSAPSSAVVPSPPLPRLELPRIATGDPLPLPDLPAIDLARPVDFTVAIAGMPAGAAGDLMPAQDAGDVVDEPPVLVEAFDLQRFYPRNARLRGIEGSTTVRIELSTDGTVTSCTVLGSTPPEIFDAATRELVRTLRFTPARNHGAPVAIAFNKTINWTLPE